MTSVELPAVTRTMQREMYKLLRSFESCDQQCLVQFGITASQGYTLVSFPEQSMISMNELSQTMGLANSTMTRMVDHLVAKGLVYRQQDYEDRRVVRVALTPQGQELRHTLEEARQAMMGEVLSDIQEEYWPGIIQTLVKLNAAVEKAMRSCCD